jgi:hypothetical protein
MASQQLVPPLRVHDPDLCDSSLVHLYDAWYERTGEAAAAAILTLAQVSACPSRSLEPATSSDYLTIAEAAAAFNISKRSLYRLTSLHRRRGRSIRIMRTDLERVLRRNLLAG